jgi:hypothetical protein
MKTNLLNTGILFLTITTGAITASAQDDGATTAPPTAAEQSVIERLRAARAAADGGAPVTPTPAQTPDFGAAPATAPGVAGTLDTNALAAAGTNAPVEIQAAPVAPNVPTPPSKAGSPAPTLAAFDLIWQRNIFDPNRQPYQAGRGFVQTRPVVQPRRVETLRFCGTVEKVGKGIDALFTGDGAPQSGVLDLGDMVNGLKIAAITNDSVTLVDPKSTNSTGFVLSTENGGRNAISRGDGGPWREIAVNTVFAAPTRPTFSPDTMNSMYNTSSIQMDPFANGDPNANFNFGGNNFAQNNFNNQNFGNGNGNGRGGRGNRGRNQNGGNGFGGATDTGGGFAPGGFGGFGGQQQTTAAPAAPADPAVLARLQARRAAENQ